MNLYLMTGNLCLLAPPPKTSHPGRSETKSRFWPAGVSSNVRALLRRQPNKPLARTSNHTSTTLSDHNYAGLQHTPTCLQSCDTGLARGKCSRPWCATDPKHNINTGKPHLIDGELVVLARVPLRVRRVRPRKQGLDVPPVVVARQNHGAPGSLGQLAQELAREQQERRFRGVISAPFKTREQRRTCSASTRGWPNLQAIALAKTCHEKSSYFPPWSGLTFAYHHPPPTPHRLTIDQYPGWRKKKKTKGRPQRYRTT